MGFGTFLELLICWPQHITQASFMWVISHISASFAYLISFKCRGGFLAERVLGLAVSVVCAVRLIECSHMEEPNCQHVHFPSASQSEQGERGGNS